MEVGHAVPGVRQSLGALVARADVLGGGARRGPLPAQLQHVRPMECALAAEGLESALGVAPVAELARPHAGALHVAAAEQARDDGAERRTCRSIADASVADQEHHAVQGVERLLGVTRCQQRPPESHRREGQRIGVGGGIRSRDRFAVQSGGCLRISARKVGRAHV